ncbi:hypothetical protein FB45DRAFT_1059706 [Roridomyces roridus]|uniref:F-box domain-containing protein n=1 Tax=Roridomyces roridus TaxID=1738132 RepID=A0AAD7FMW4_9AGAR|nr:hypothetical protein FB45DRAFT_1059706 [Roridomyces roridus]
MHRALQIDEIVGMICVQISRAGPSDWSAGLPTEEYSSYCDDLARLARTCTAFLDPALDALWSFQGTLLYLLRTMPSDLWDIEVTPYGEDSDADCDDPENDIFLDISLKRTSRTSDWDRFSFYARRVRSFKDAHASEGTSVVYDTLAANFPSGTIFPKLQILDWSPLDGELFHHVHIFLCTRITRLELNLDLATDFAIFKTLLTTFTGLKNLNLCTGFDDVNIHSVTRDPLFRRFLCSMQDLETFVTPSLDSETLDHLSRLPRLRYLALMSDTPPRLPPRPNHLPCFPALSSFECESLEAAPNLLERTGKSLIEFRVSSSIRATSPTKKIYQQLCDALASSCTHTLLEEITVDKACDEQPINPTQLDLYAVSGDDLRILFCFRNLLYVSLAHCIAVDLDDTVALDMARAWPCIELLAFPCDTTHRIKPRMTLEGVYAFAQHCPLLEELSILFDATTVPTLKLTTEGKKQRRVSQEQLTFLNVAYSHIGTTEKEGWRVADFLLTIFPELETVTVMELNSSAGEQALAMHEAWIQLCEDFF